jgi:hypothetical protein
VNAYDRTRRDRDVTTDSAQLSTRYKAQQATCDSSSAGAGQWTTGTSSETSGIEQTALRDPVRRALPRPDDDVRERHGAEPDDLHLRAAWAGRSRARSCRSAGCRAELPLGAASRPTCSCPTRLIDGILTASAAVNVGFRSSPLVPWEVGARFADVSTDVNTIHVWLAPGAADRALTPEVGNALAASVRVYWSNDVDQQPWTLVEGTVAAPSPFENRIDIQIPQRRARFLKVILTPLAAGITTDTAFQDVFVTEVQFQLVLPIDQVPRTASTVLLSVTGIARTKILREPELDHDISLSLSRRTEPSLTSYTIVNGLSVRRTLWADIVATARAARRDWTGNGTGHLAVERGRRRSYSGTATDRDKACTVTALARADLYEGISAQASGAAPSSAQGLREARSGNAAAPSRTPNAYVP